MNIQFDFIREKLIFIIFIENHILQFYSKNLSTKFLFRKSGFTKKAVFTSLITKIRF